MAETGKEYGDRVLGPERTDRGVRAIASLVWAWTLDETSAARAQRVPAAFFDKIEPLIEVATGARKRTLLEAYDLFLTTIEEQLADLPKRRK